MKLSRRAAEIVLTLAMLSVRLGGAKLFVPKRGTSAIARDRSFNELIGKERVKAVLEGLLFAPTPIRLSR